MNLPRQILNSMDYLFAYMGIHHFRGERLRTSNTIMGVRSSWSNDKYLKGFYDCWITVEVWEEYGDISISCLGMEAFPYDPNESLQCVADAIDPTMRVAVEEYDD